MSFIVCSLDDTTSHVPLYKSVSEIQTHPMSGKFSMIFFQSKSRQNHSKSELTYHKSLAMLYYQ